MKSSVVIAVVLVAIFVAVESKPYHETPPPTTHYYHHPTPTERLATDCDGYAYRDTGFCSGKNSRYGYYKYDADCTCFIQCDNFATHVRPCAPGTRWNQYIKTCEHGTNCDEITPPTYVKPPTTSPPIPCKNSDYDSFSCVTNGGHYYYAHPQYFEYPKDCACYYQCSKDATKHIMHCGPKTVWNQALKTCVHECPNSCGGRPTDVVCDGNYGK